MKKRVLYNMALCSTLVFISYVFAASKDTDATLMKKGMWRDQKTNLVWMRCSLGQTWDGKTCVGKAIAYTWDEAIKAAKVLNKKGGFGGHINWNVPHIEDLMTIHLCKTGFEYKIEIPTKAGGTKKVGEYCRESKNKHSAFNSVIFPNTEKDWYWALPLLSNGYEGYLAYFGNGYDESYEHHYNYVRLVRTNQ